MWNNVVSYLRLNELAPVNIQDHSEKYRPSLTNTVNMNLDPSQRSNKQTTRRVFESYHGLM